MVGAAAPQAARVVELGPVRQIEPEHRRGVAEEVEIDVVGVRVRPRPLAHLPSKAPVGLNRLARGAGRRGDLAGIGVEQGVGPVAVSIPEAGHELVPRRPGHARVEGGALVGQRPDDHRHVVLLAGREDRAGQIGQDPAVDHDPRAAAGLEHRRRLGCPEGRRRVGSLALDPESGRDGQTRVVAGNRGRRADGRRQMRARGAEAAAGVADGLVEQSLRQGRRLKHAHRPGTGRLAEDGDVAGVAPERRDVVAHPLEGRDVVEDAVVARRLLGRLGGQGGMGEEAEGPQAVVGGHHDHALLRHRAAVEDPGAASARAVAAAVEPHHHRPALAHPRRRPQVQGQAVLAARQLAPRIGRVVGVAGLPARGPELGGRPRPVPRLHRRGRAPAQVADRRLREGHAPEHRDAGLRVGPRPFELTRGRQHHRPALRLGGGAGRARRHEERGQSEDHNVPHRAHRNLSPPGDPALRRSHPGQSSGTSARDSRGDPAFLPISCRSFSESRR